MPKGFGVERGEGGELQHFELGEGTEAVRQDFINEIQHSSLKWDELGKSLTNREQDIRDVVDYRYFRQEIENLSAQSQERRAQFMDVVNTELEQYQKKLEQGQADAGVRERSNAGLAELQKLIDLKKQLWENDDLRIYQRCLGDMDKREQNWTQYISAQSRERLVAPQREELGAAERNYNMVISFYQNDPDRMAEARRRLEQATGQYNTEFDRAYKGSGLIEDYEEYHAMLPDYNIPDDIDRTSIAPYYAYSPRKFYTGPDSKYTDPISKRAVVWIHYNDINYSNFYSELQEKLKQLEKTAQPAQTERLAA